MRRTPERLTASTDTRSAATTSASGTGNGTVGLAPETETPSVEQLQQRLDEVTRNLDRAVEVLREYADMRASHYGKSMPSQLGQRARDVLTEIGRD